MMQIVRTMGERVLDAPPSPVPNPPSRYNVQFKNAANGLVGEGGENPSRHRESKRDPIAALTSAEHRFSSPPNPTAADSSAESPTYNSTYANAAFPESSLNAEKPKALRCEAATGAAIATEAMRIVRDERNLPPYAICIDQRSLATFMQRAWTEMIVQANLGAALPNGADARQLSKYRDLTRDDWNTRKKVARCIRYAVEAGMLIRLSGGRRKPSSDEKGIVAWYALPVDDVAAPPFRLPDNDIARLEAVALRRIAGNQRTAAAFKEYSGRTAQYDAEQRRRKSARDDRDIRWGLTIAAGG